MLYGLGATYGYVQVARCSALRRETERDDADDSPGSSSNGNTPPRNQATASASRAPGSEDDPPQGPAPGTEDAAPANPELPSWSAFRRYPLQQEQQPRPPAVDGE